MGQCTSSQYQLNNSAAAAHIRTTSSKYCDIPTAKDMSLPLMAPIDDDSTITHQTPTDESNNRRGSRHRVSFSSLLPRFSVRKGIEEDFGEVDNDYARVPSVVLVPPPQRRISLRTRRSQSLK